MLAPRHERRKRYTFACDDDGHWFIVPVEQHEAFDAYLEAAYSEGRLPELPLPAGVISLGCSYTQYTFTDPKLERDWRYEEPNVTPRES